MVAGTWPTSHRTCSQLTQPPGIIDNSGVGAVEQFYKSKTYLVGVATLWVVPVNLSFGRIVRGMHEKYGWCMSTWCLEDLPDDGMRNIGGVCKLDVWKTCQRQA